MSSKIYGGRWEVVGPLDEGGQGWIYEVRDTSGELDRPLVLKRLKNPNRRLDRFKKEIEVQRKLEHEGIAPVLDFSLDDPPYFVTPRYDGDTLEQVGQLWPLKALEVFSKLCDVVHYAHQEGVVHRDLKPSNVILTNDDQIVVLDFGLCYFEDEDHRLTETMEQIGSRFYIAPELEAGRADAVTAAVDCYALGKILYFLLTGKQVAREYVADENDLVAVTGDRQLGYVMEQILAVSVVSEPTKRVDAHTLCKRARNVHRLIREHRYPGREGSLCRFCGEGFYRRVPHMMLRVGRPGTLTNEEFEVLICKNCSHVEWFL